MTESKEISSEKIVEKKESRWLVSRLFQKIVKSFGFRDVTMEIVSPKIPYLPSREQLKMITDPIGKNEKKLLEPDFFPSEEPGEDNSKCFVVETPKSPEIINEETLHSIVLSDTGNCIKCIDENLKFAGILTEDREWQVGIKNIKIIHTGDWTNKNKPSPFSIDYLKELQESAPPTCEVILLNGNHEIEIYREIGKKKGRNLDKKHYEFIKKQHFIHASKNILYIHGYPTLKLIQLLKQFRDGGLLDLNKFNDRFRDSFFSQKHEYFMEDESLEILGDFEKSYTKLSRYYAKNINGNKTCGQVISGILKELGFDTIIHGHKPQSGVQKDWELKDEIPEIRMINNDTQVSRNILGSIMIKESEIKPPKIVFNNLPAGVMQKKAKKIMGTRKKDLEKIIENN